MDFAADRRGMEWRGGGAKRKGGGRYELSHHTNHVGITTSGLDSTCRATGNSIPFPDNTDLSGSAAAA